MKRICIPLTILFLLLMVVPSIANDYYQVNREYERAQRETESYNANVLQEYEKQMREYEETIRANRSLLRRVQEQFPEIGAKPTASEPNKDLQESPMREAVGHESSLTVKSSQKSNSEAIAPEGKSSTQENSTRKKIYRRQRTATRYNKSRRTNVTSQGQVSTFNTNNQRADEEQRREYERQVKAYEAKKKEVEKLNADLRKEYERQRAEVEKHNAEVKKRNEQIRQYNAERRARYNAQQQNSREGSKYIEHKPYLQDEYPERPYHQRWQIDQGWDSVSGGGGNSRRENYQRQTMPNQQGVPNQRRR